ncbi:hypothetical protein [Streptomyces sp. NPDC086835]|jgi:hypothetical protein|uniref:hypothetical protein n=1 Tax=Streptomyces sp. NPDC086835 TaxID=3365761 RepID=UPI0038152869
MQLAELVRPQHRGDDRRPAAAVGTEDTPEAPTAANGKADGPANDSAAERRKDADGMAVAAFVLGLVGLLVMNIVLGPTAVVLAALALRRGTVRRGRALLGLALGVADLVVLAVLVTVNGTVVWGFGG